EELLRAVNRELLCDVDELAATVVALAGESLGVLVRELRPLGREHVRARVVLRGDQLDVVFLASILLLDRGPQLRVGLREATPGGEHEAFKGLEIKILP